jgi:uncharacterized protein
MIWIDRCIVFLVILLSSCARFGPSTMGNAVRKGSTEIATTQTFSFEVHGNRLVGLLDIPNNQTPTSTIIIVHGYGKTNVVEQNWYSDLRSNFARIGISVLVWDKPGCGQSGGEFDINQPVESSAEEVVAAVHALQAREVMGGQRIGLWGISRAGWIAPLDLAPKKRTHG